MKFKPVLTIFLLILLVSIVGCGSVIKQQYAETFQLIDNETGKPLAYYPYKLKTESGKIVDGRTDANGYTKKIESDKLERVYLVDEEKIDQLEEVTKTETK